MYSWDSLFAFRKYISTMMIMMIMFQAFSFHLIDRCFKFIIHRVSLYDWYSFFFWLWINFSHKKSFKFSQAKTLTYSTVSSLSSFYCKTDGIFVWCHDLSPLYHHQIYVKSIELKFDSDFKSWLMMIHDYNDVLVELRKKLLVVVATNRWWRCKHE